MYVLNQLVENLSELQHRQFDHHFWLYSRTNNFSTYAMCRIRVYFTFGSPGVTFFVCVCAHSSTSHYTIGESSPELTLLLYLLLFLSLFLLFFLSSDQILLSASYQYHFDSLVWLFILMYFLVLVIVRCFCCLGLLSPGTWYRPTLLSTSNHYVVCKYLSDVCARGSFPIDRINFCERSPHNSIGPVYLIRFIFITLPPTHNVSIISLFSPSTGNHIFIKEIYLLPWHHIQYNGHSYPPPPPAPQPAEHNHSWSSNTEQWILSFVYRDQSAWFDETIFQTTQQPLFANAWHGNNIFAHTDLISGCQSSAFTSIPIDVCVSMFVYNNGCLMLTPLCCICSFLILNFVPRTLFNEAFHASHYSYDNRTTTKKYINYLSSILSKRVKDFTWKKNGRT